VKKTLSNPIFLFLSALLISSSLVGGSKSHVKATLVSDVKKIQIGTPFRLGVRLQMEDKWHTYWKNPGDSGGPTQITWELPEGFTAGPIEWPYPQLIQTPPLASYGYETETLLLTKITPNQKESTFGTKNFKASVRWLECADVCIPGEASLSLQLPFSPTPPKIDPRWVELFSIYRAKLPLKKSNWSIQGEETLKKIQLVLSPPLDSGEDLGSVTFFPEKPGLINHPAPQKRFTKDGNIHLTVFKSELSTASLSSISGVLVSEKGWRGKGSERALEVQISLKQKKDTSQPSLALIFLFAFLGGLLLNFMPCVLPILSIKILSLMNHNGTHRIGMRVHGLLYTLGVLSAFWVLALVMILLSHGGRQLGWGFQLQSPFFVGILSLFFFGLGLNLLNVFEMGVSFSRVGDSLVPFKGSLPEGMMAYLTGILATVVATPCTAPFMGAALGYALTQPPLISLGIFSFLGLGMASLFLLVCYYPPLLKILPKPGPWMMIFKNLMGFLMLGTVLWLVWVYSLQTSKTLPLLLLISLFIVGVACWIWGLSNRAESSIKRRILGILILLFLGGALFLIKPTGVSSSSVIPTKDFEPLRNKKGIHWEPYSLEKLQTLKKEGRVVFIDFTAAWCLTCQVNERVVFSRREIIDQFKKLNISALKADWTSGDESITKALQSYGRNGVPLYVLIGGKGESPKILPQILTPKILLEALKEPS